MEQSEKGNISTFIKNNPIQAFSMLLVIVLLIISYKNLTADSMIGFSLLVLVYLLYRVSEYRLTNSFRKKIEAQKEQNPRNQM